MGDKIASKKLAIEAGVNTIPGHNQAVASPDEAVAIANRIGYPVMIKASAGGGGKGLRIAHDDTQCREGLTACRNEAKNAFGDDRVFIEKFIEEPRHIEIQVLGDAHGNYVYLNERECSIQRRHQKVIEEAPSPFIDEATRKAMGEQAVQLARAVKYQSAGTVEFVVGKDRSFYFLEMNTRLQVEHPVTEFITGLDLVELMIRVAAGERLPLTQKDVRRTGWALECRINAEDPLRGFLPSSGRLVKFIPPPDVPGQVRVDTGVYEGGEVSMYYDSMIAKLICHGATRDQAIARMREALNAFVIRGVASNIAFQAALLQNPRFLSGNFNTGLIAEEYPKGFQATSLVHDDPLLLAAVAALARRRFIARAVQTTGQLRGHQRHVGDDWVVAIGAQRFALRLTAVPGGCRIECEGETSELLSDWKFGDLIFRGLWNGQDVCLQIQRVGWKYRLMHWGTQVDATVLTARQAYLLSLMPAKPAPDLSRFLLSPMPGLLTDLLVKAGQEVKAGERLAVIEAMKMENTLRAEADSVVKEVFAARGDSLSVDQPILAFE
jgi:propionyl-CoA carboxylase alpha chain